MLNPLATLLHFSYIFSFKYKDIRGYVMHPDLTNIYKFYLHNLIIKEMIIFTHSY
jgi:hypothetical protein